MKLQRKHYTKSDIKERASASLFFAPFAILFILFILVPIILSAIFSLTSYLVVQEPIFVGPDIQWMLYGTDHHNDKRSYFLRYPLL